MTLDYYRIFYYVAKYKSFSKAAQILGNNQPNITRYINLLEHELGCNLCVRTHKGISLTPEGQLLYEHVEAAMYQLKNAQDALKKNQSLESGTITIGVSDTALRLYLSDKLETFLSLYPNVRIKLTNNFTTQAITALEKGLVDFCIVTTPFSIDRAFTQNTLYTFEEILIGGRKYEHLADNILNIKDLSSYPYISLNEGSGSYSLYSEYFYNNHLHFEPEMLVYSTDQIMPLIRSNLGLAFYPEELATDELNKGNIYNIKLNESVPQRQVCLIQNPKRIQSIAVKRFLDILLQK